MDVTTAIITAAGAAAVAIIGGWFTYRGARGVETKTGFDVYGEALDRADRRMTELERRLGAVERDLQNAHSRMANVTYVLRRHLVPILAWMDGGAGPPLPEIHQELRDLAMGSPFGPDQPTT